MAAGKGYDHVPSGLEYLRVGRSEMDPDLERQSRGYDQLANSSMPYCRYAGIVLLKEKIVSNNLIDLQYMWVKDFIHKEWPVSDPKTTM